MRNPFVSKPSLSELQERDEYKEVELSLAKKSAMIRELENRGGDWKQHSENGKKSGINFGSVWHWIKTH